MRTSRLGMTVWAGVALCGVGVWGAGEAAGQNQPRGRGGMGQPGMTGQPGMMGQDRVRGGRVSPDERRRLANHHADVNAEISAENIGELTRVWGVQTQGNVTHAPLIDNGRVYFADWDGNAYCVEQETGQEVWRKTLGRPNQEWPWHGFVGTGALGDGGRVWFLASAEGTAYAVNTEDGEVVWEQEISEDEHAGSTCKLLHHEGLVYIGLSSVEEFLHEKEQGFEPDFRGRVMALDAQSGEVVWNADLVREPSNGVAVWGGFALDPDAGTLFFSTGNNLTGEPSSLSDAVLAVDARSGDLLWAQQATPNDIWTKANPQGPGFAFMAAPQLFNAVIDGERRRLVGAGQKSGMFYVWDRQSGEPVWGTQVGYGHIGGGIFAEASIGRDQVFLTGNNAFAYEDPEQHPADVKAVDIATGRPMWVKARAMPAQLMSTGFLASDVYLAGSLDGKVRAFGAEDGEVVWTSGEHASIASPIKVHEGMICFGTGIPEMFGGREEGERGVFCYRAGAQAGDAAARQQREAGGAERAAEGPQVRPAADRLRQQRDQQQQTPRAAPAVQRGDEVEGLPIRIVIRENRFEPSELRVRPGQAVTVLLVNESDAKQNLEFDLAEGEKAKFDAPVEPRQQKSMTFVAPKKPGKYTFSCPVEGRAERAIKGTLVVEEEAKPDQGGGAHEER